MRRCCSKLRRDPDRRYDPEYFKYTMKIQRADLVAAGDDEQLRKLLMQKIYDRFSAVDPETKIFDWLFL